MKIILNLQEKEELREIHLNFYEDEVPEAYSTVLKSIVEKITNDEDVSSSELIILQKCIDRDISDFNYGIEHEKSCEHYESISNKISLTLKSDL